MTYDVNKYLESAPPGLREALLKAIAKPYTYVPIDPDDVHIVIPWWWDLRTSAARSLDGNPRAKEYAVIYPRR